MKLLYVDNFRGFQNTYIPIKDVNFLVGENSTGKTSILSLLQVISSPQFWFSNVFGADSVNFGHFNDIVSVGADNRTYFSVGLLETTNPGKTKERQQPQINAFIVTYKEREGLPYPAFFAYLNNDTEIRAQITPKQIKYKKIISSQAIQIDDFIQNVFSKWTNAHCKDNTGYKRLPKELNVADIPLMFLASVIEQEFSDKTARHHPPKSFMSVMKDIAWLAPIRTKPRRTYDEYKLDFSAEGIHTPYLIKNILEKKALAPQFIAYLERVGMDTGLFDSIKVKKYGQRAISPFELDVVMNNCELSISNVGYGVSQALPLIVEMFARPKGAWFAIQQPEVHLHPKAQAALGDIIFDMSVKEKKKFIVETHSDYTIDRYRLNCAKQRQSTRPEAQILYFERAHNGNAMYPLQIQDNGELPTEQPAGYREFFVKEELQLLGL